jgi:hypothetical protein
VLKALTGAADITAWSGQKASIDLRKGGYFSLFNGDITGKNRKVSKKQIVQDWKESGWEAHSIVIFNLSAGEGDTTVVELIHENIPDKSFAGIKSGWDKYYMLPLKKWVEDANAENSLLAKFSALPGVQQGKMFGWECLKVNGNVFLTITPDAVVVKLDADNITRALKVKGSDYFQPMKGAPKMKEWVALPVSAGKSLSSLVEASYAFVKKMPSKKNGKK